MTVKQKDEIIDMLENLLYWDTCPQDYKDRIPELVKALSKVNNGVLGDVSKQSELLKAFIDFYNYRNTGDKTIYNDEIEIFIDSL
tara:strand:+ start:259 stop:513 length:255 start_codon:yes stop_codon:yes gene_type:complete